MPVMFQRADTKAPSTKIADMVRPGGAIGVQKTNRRDKKTKQKVINGFCVA
jgi:hypothetical protein